MTDSTQKLNPCPFCGQTATTKTSGDWHAAGCTTYMAPGVLCYGQSIALQYRTEAEAIAAWNNRAPAETAAPEGWRLVPVEPTEAMLRAHSDNCDGLDPQLAQSDWAVMLAAAPTISFDSPPCAGVAHPLNKKDRA
ncbi:Lar family restriction alleviation protein [Cupriavidus sp. CV2]|uniref:Lar family restriction alleviation protein n=1 Tax=Cupriavidus ulmosensis TaxID=3065913 RepID=UPI00296AAC99|nr:Lar family restriction alleviation protein [Cupriavidus sp. CV2]MDW3683352.1 Lar family restriction alleviation protein [Cupriavidus sp. CV2]